MLASAMALATVGSPLIGVIAPYLRTEIAIAPGDLGWLVAVYAAVSAVASWPAGFFTDRLGGTRALLLVFIGSGLALVGIAAANSLGWLVGTMVVAGLANSGVNPATNHVIAETVQPGKRGVVAGVKMAGVQVGVFAAGLMIPATVATLGDWRVPLAVGGVLLAAAGATAVHIGIAETSHGSSRSMTKLKWSRRLAILTTYSLLMGAGSSAALTYLPLYSVDVLGATAGVGGVGVAVAGLFAVIGRLFWGRITERSLGVMSPLVVLAALSVLSGSLILLAADVASPLLWAGICGMGFFALSFTAATTVALILTVPPAQTGSASGVMFVGFLIGFGIGPAAFGALVESPGSYTTAWLSTAGLFACALVLAWVGERRSQPTNA